MRANSATKTDLGPRRDDEWHALAHEKNRDEIFDARFCVTALVNSIEQQQRTPRGISLHEHEETGTVAIFESEAQVHRDEIIHTLVLGRVFGHRALQVDDQNEDRDGVVVVTMPPLGTSVNHLTHHHSLRTLSL